MLARKPVLDRSPHGAGDERVASKRVLVAKPKERPVDFQALREKVAARFPKVLAHLAK